MKLPRGVHRVVSRGREYFYWQPKRNTKGAGGRIKLPNDPTSPEFWQAIRAQRGHVEPAVVNMESVFDKYMAWLATRKDITDETKRKYGKSIDLARRGIGHRKPESIESSDILAMLDELIDVPGTANNLLATMRALSSWGVPRKHFSHPITHGLKPYKSDGGHKPWTAGQCLAAERNFTDMVRRAYFLARYTGQRGSDVVRLNPGMIDEGGFRIAQQKTGREVWCPIDDRLAAEMATWDIEFVRGRGGVERHWDASSQRNARIGGQTPEERCGPDQTDPHKGLPDDLTRPVRARTEWIGPYLYQHWGKVYGRKLLTKQFAAAVAEIPELAGVTFHGLRGTRVVELRQRGATSTQIQDQVGMSLNMIERYCRFADKKANGKASVIALKRKAEA